MIRTICAAGAVLALAFSATPAAAQQQPQARPGATNAIAMFDGVWIGPAVYTRPNGVYAFEQMERIGPMLAGEIRVMEGKARDGNGNVLFQALTVFSPAPDGGVLMRSYTPGDADAREIALKDDGFDWTIEHPDGGRTLYEITIADDVWSETGVRIGPDGQSTKFFEMTLTRVGDTDWPGDNPDFPTND